jgi:hypothetical protein
MRALADPKSKFSPKKSAKPRQVFAQASLAANLPISRGLPLANRQAICPCGGGCPRCQPTQAAGPVIMRQPSFERYCYNPRALSAYTLLNEIKRLENSQRYGMCLNKTESEQEYYEALLLEAERRGLLTHPTGIDNTRVYSRLQYGAAFTHTLSLSQGGIAADLHNTQVTETLRIVRDDFQLPRAKSGLWKLGIPPGSNKSDEFIDSIETGQYGVHQATSTRKMNSSPLREELQTLYWRRHPKDPWQRFASINIRFQLVHQRGRVYAVTTDNGVRVKQLYHGIPP